MGKGIEHFSKEEMQTANGWAHEKMLNIANNQGTANQKHNEIFTSYLSEVLSSKTTSGTNAGKDMEKRQPSNTVYGNVN